MHLVPMLHAYGSDSTGIARGGDPEVITISDMKDERPELHDEWMAWGTMRAVSNDIIHCFTKNAWGAENICGFIDSAR